MGNCNRNVFSESQGELNLSLNIAQTQKRQLSWLRAVRNRRKAFSLVAACLFFFCLMLLLSGFSSIPSTDGVSKAGLADAGVGAWQELAEGVVKRASDFQVMAELGDGEPSAKVVIETNVAFENNKDRLTPDYAKFLAGITLILQIKPDVHITITGFGNNPATNYNPVLLGKRVRAVQVFFAENGIPISQTEAGVKEADAYEGPNTFLGKAASGQVITVRFA